MTKDGHLTGRQSKTNHMIRVGVLVAISAMQATAYSEIAQQGVVGHDQLYGAGYAPDISCEPSFHSGECSDHSFCLEIWQNYCYERHPRGKLGCGLMCRLHGLVGCHTGCGDGCAQGCGNQCSSESVGASAPLQAPQAPPVEPPTAVAEEAVSKVNEPAEQPKAVSAAPSAPYETAPVTPPQSFPPDLKSSSPTPPVESQIPPEPKDIPFSPPANELPRNELPLLPVSIASISSPKSAPVPAAEMKAVYSWKQDTQEPPVPAAMNLAASETIENSGTLRLVEQLDRVTDRQ